MSTRVFWPPGEAAQADYEMLRAHLLQVAASCPPGWPLPGSPAAGWPG